jgi:hypothetical protein
MHRIHGALQSRIELYYKRIDLDPAGAGYSWTVPLEFRLVAVQLRIVHDENDMLVIRGSVVCCRLEDSVGQFLVNLVESLLCICDS